MSTTTLYAKWTANAVGVTLNTQGGAFPSSGTQTVYYANGTNKYYSNSSCTTVITNVGVPTMSDGGTFLGYYSAAQGGTQYISASGAILSTLCSYSGTNLYAQWSISVTINSYNGTFYIYDGAVSTVIQSGCTSYTVSGVKLTDGNYNILISTDAISIYSGDVRLDFVHNGSMTEYNASILLSFNNSYHTVTNLGAGATWEDSLGDCTPYDDLETSLAEISYATSNIIIEITYASGGGASYGYCPSPESYQNNHNWFFDGGTVYGGTCGKCGSYSSTYNVSGGACQNAGCNYYWNREEYSCGHYHYTEADGQDYWG